MSRRFVSENATRYPVTRLCTLVDVRRSTFYELSTHTLSQRDLDDEVLTAENVEIHEASQATMRHASTDSSATVASGSGASASPD